MDQTLGWLALPLGLALGLLPPRWFYSAGCRHFELVEARGFGLRSASAGSSGRRRRRWWKLPLFWIDPFRGFATGHLIATGLRAAADSLAFPGPVSQLAHAFLLAAVLWMQTHAGRQAPGQLLAPVAFVLGLTAGLFPAFGIVGAAVGLLALATMLAAHSFTWGYLMAGAAALAIGFPFLGPGPSLLLFALVAASPILVAFVRRATLVIPLRG